MVAVVCLLATACSSSGGRTATTPAPAALRIPSPFEVGQKVGVGDVTLMVTCFRHDGDALRANVTATNAAGGPITVDPTRDFTVFAGTERRPAERVAGPRPPIPPGGQVSFGLRFRVPATFRYPLLWFDDRSPGSNGVTIVLRGAGPSGAPDCRV